MAKDPAVLFYYSDFLVGTEFMTDEEVGKYIRILCHQADKGRLTKKQVLSVCKANVIPEMILDKLTIDENGLYYQQRMEVEKVKRSNFVESRRKSALSIKSVSTAYAERMEDINKDIDIVVNKKNIEERMTEFELEVMLYKGTYPEKMLVEFYNYWSEPNPSKSKMKKELQKTWDTKRRLNTWNSNQEKFGVKDGFRNTQQGKGTYDPEQHKRLLSQEPV